jgi:prephenate dehydrogenase
MRIGTLTIVGVGLIGGSIGLAARRVGLADCILGTGRNAASLETARRLGRVDEVVLGLGDAVRRADVAVFCTPVDAIAGQVVESACGCKEGTLLTDAGSTKADILRALDGRLPHGVDFVGSHPLAGSEKQGPEHATADLFVGRLAIVTPTRATSDAAVARTVQFWQALGARVRLMSPEEHDRALALTSHLPHLVASALAGLLPPELRDLAATGFRDTTRIAAGDPGLWTAIFAHNRDAVREALARFEDRIAAFRDALDTADRLGLADLLTQAKKVRDALGS